MVNYLPPKAGDVRDASSIPGSGRSPGGGRGNPLQNSCLENPMDRIDWWAAVHRVARSWTQLKRLIMYAHLKNTKQIPIFLQNICSVSFLCIVQDYSCEPRKYLFYSPCLSTLSLPQSIDIGWSQGGAAKSPGIIMKTFSVFETQMYTCISDEIVETKVNI